jgi:hypothetical protein
VRTLSWHLACADPRINQPPVALVAPARSSERFRLEAVMRRVAPYEPKHALAYESRRGETYDLQQSWRDYEPRKIARRGRAWRRRGQRTRGAARHPQLARWWFTERARDLPRALAHLEQATSAAPHGAPTERRAMSGNRRSKGRGRTAMFEAADRVRQESRGIPEPELWTRHAAAARGVIAQPARDSASRHCESSRRPLCRAALGGAAARHTRVGVARHAGATATHEPCASSAIGAPPRKAARRSRPARTHCRSCTT